MNTEGNHIKLWIFAPIAIITMGLAIFIAAVDIVAISMFVGDLLCHI